MAKNRRDRRSRSARKTLKTRRDRRRDRRTRNRNRKSMRGGLVLSPSPINESLANSWSSKASLNQGDDFFKYHQGQHGGASNITGAPFPALVEHSSLPSELYPSAHQSGVMRANQAIIGLSDADGTPPIVPSQSGGPANTTGGRRRRARRGTRRARRDRRRKQSRRNRKSRRTHGGSLGYSSVNAPTMLLPNRQSYDAAALNPEYVSIKGYAEGIAAEARDKVGFA